METQDSWHTSVVTLLLECELEYQFQKQHAVIRHRSTRTVKYK